MTLFFVALLLLALSVCWGMRKSKLLFFESRIFTVTRWQNSSKKWRKIKRKRATMTLAPIAEAVRAPYQATNRLGWNLVASLFTVRARTMSSITWQWAIKREKLATWVRAGGVRRTCQILPIINTYRWRRHTNTLLTLVVWWSFRQPISTR